MSKQKSNFFSVSNIVTFLIVAAMFSAFFAIIHEQINGKEFAKVEAVSFKYVGEIKRSTQTHYYLKDANSNQLTETSLKIKSIIDSDSNVILYRHFYNYENSYFKEFFNLGFKLEDGYFSYLSLEKNIPKN